MSERFPDVGFFPLVYDELRRLAAHKRANESPGQALQATALVHGAYLRLVGTDQDGQWDGRTHFLAAAAQAMRRILVENARRKARQKRGGGLVRIDLDDIRAPDRNEDLLALDDALDRLAVEDSVAARVVELRQFAGMGIRRSWRPLASPSTSLARSGLMPGPGSARNSAAEPPFA
jgi:RNA polymerase sigma factor (TIGR02999 family)